MHTVVPPPPKSISHAAAAAATASVAVITSSPNKNFALIVGRVHGRPSSSFNPTSSLDSSRDTDTRWNVKTCDD